MRYTRRGLLVSGFCALIAAVLYKSQRPDPIDVLSKRLRTLFPEIVAAAPMVLSISELAPLRGNRVALADSIFSSDLAIAAESTALETMDFLGRTIDRDFADGRLIAIKGWTLSQTEARLLAFIAAGET
jgi:hypothetical protein